MALYVRANIVPLAHETSAYLSRIIRAAANLVGKPAGEVNVAMVDGRLAVNGI